MPMQSAERCPEALDEALEECIQATGVGRAGVGDQGPSEEGLLLHCVVRGHKSNYTSTAQLDTLTCARLA
jgi:hypothetical protein